MSSLSPLWGLFILAEETHGLRRGLHSFAASRLALLIAHLKLEAMTIAYGTLTVTVAVVRPN